MKDENKIVADGRERVRNTADYRTAEFEIRFEYAKQYSEQSQGLGRLARVRLRIRLWLRMRRELGKLAPLSGNYLLSPGDA